MEDMRIRVYGYDKHNNELCTVDVESGKQQFLHKFKERGRVKMLKEAMAESGKINHHLLKRTLVYVMMPEVKDGYLDLVQD